MSRRQVGPLMTATTLFCQHVGQRSAGQGVVVLGAGEGGDELAGASASATCGPIMRSRFSEGSLQPSGNWDHRPLNPGPFRAEKVAPAAIRRRLWAIVQGPLIRFPASRSRPRQSPTPRLIAGRGQKGQNLVAVVTRQGRRGLTA